MFARIKLSFQLFQLDEEAPGSIKIVCCQENEVKLKALHEHAALDNPAMLFLKYHAGIDIYPCTI
jgi:hypothetical protein